MRFPRISLINAALAVALCAGSAYADELQRGGNVTCKGPFLNTETGLDVMARYKSAKIEEVAGLDEEPINVAVLFPTEPRARLEIQDRTADDGSGRVEAVNLREKNSLWTIEGFSTGMTPAELTAANGGPVTLSGIEALSEGTFGMLGWLERGGCTVVVAFYAPEGVGLDHPLYGKEVTSDDPRLKALNLKLDVIILQLAQPPEE